MNWSRPIHIVAAAAIAVAAFAVGWRYFDSSSSGGVSKRSQASNTAVLGSYGPPPAAAIPPPPAPRNSAVAVVNEGARDAIAVWTQAGDLFSARYTPEAGWSEARPLEQILGVASDLQLAGNGHGVAMAVWRHTVGGIDSLRYSRHDAESGWSPPDVVPGVLPRGATSAAKPVLSVDARGNATLQWPSAFAAGVLQSSRFEPGRGWSAPQDLAAR
jgi:hypothetical protein